MGPRHARLLVYAQEYPESQFPTVWPQGDLELPGLQPQPPAESAQPGESPDAGYQPEFG